MKVLIGAPIHETKDHAIKKWLAKVAKLMQKTPADLLMVDSSPDNKYLEQAKNYCAEYGIKDYKLQHIEAHQANGMDEMVGRSREAIRQHLLASDYEAWFSWQVGREISDDTLEKLIDSMETNGYLVVSNNMWEGKNLEATHPFLSCALIHKWCLKKYGFLLDYANMPGSWHNADNWFKERLHSANIKFMEVDLGKPADLLNKLTKQKPLKINLGCGRKHKKGYINIDIQEPCDVQMDLRESLPFDPNAVDEVFCEGNTIALFTPPEWEKIKLEIVRILKVGGKLEIIFLNFEYILRAFLDDRDGERWGWWRQTIFSGQDNEYDYSKNGFTYDKLVSDLHSVGMGNFAKLPVAGDYTHPEGYIHLTCNKQREKEQ